MNPKLAGLLVRLYPRAWRERYGEEFQAVLESGGSGFNASANVACSALSERLFPTLRPSNPHTGRFRSWCVRAPWAIFGLGPPVLLAAAYFVALLLLWSGWKIFLPKAETPFGEPLSGMANMYFQANRLFYFAAPVLVGWAIGVFAAREKVNAVWPSLGLILIAFMGAMNQLHASRTAVPKGTGHIWVAFSRAASIEVLLHATAILILAALPSLIWHLYRTYSPIA